jgi:ankyrin repeat protein
VQVDEVKKLLSADPMLITCKTEQGYSPTLLAAMYGQGEVVRLCLEKGARPNEVDGDFRRSALHWVAEKDLASTVLALRSFGADPNLKVRPGIGRGG